MTEGHEATTVESGNPALSSEQLEELNSSIRYVMFSVFAVAEGLPDNRKNLVDEVQEVLESLDGKGLEVRGVYDVAGFRADADFLIWWHAPAIETLQDAYHRLRQTELGSYLEPVWSQVGLHRPAEFNRSHVPAFLSGEEARDYICVYPFVRSYEWYLLPEAERRTMLRDHGLAAKDFVDVRANTVASFALGDYEWLLAFEADELHRIVDLMRELRATEARRHVREEIPFFTGPKVSWETLVGKLP